MRRARSCNPGTLTQIVLHCNPHCWVVFHSTGFTGRQHSSGAPLRRLQPPRRVLQTLMASGPHYCCLHPRVKCQTTAMAGHERAFSRWPLPPGWGKAALWCTLPRSKFHWFPSQRPHSWESRDLRGLLLAALYVLACACSFYSGEAVCASADIFCRCNLSKTFDVLGSEVTQGMSVFVIRNTGQVLLTYPENNAFEIRRSIHEHRGNFWAVEHEGKCHTMTFILFFFFFFLIYCLMEVFPPLFPPPSQNLTPMLVRHKSQAPRKHWKTCPVEFKGLDMSFLYEVLNITWV